MHPILGAMSGTKPLVLATYGLVVLSTMGLGRIAYQDRGELENQAQSSLDRPGALSLSTLNQTLSDLRRASIAELEKALDGQTGKLEPQSLLAASCEEGGLLAGAAISGSTGTSDASEGESRTTEPSASEPSAASADGEMIGVVVIVHSSPTGRSAEASGTHSGHAAEAAGASAATHESDADGVPNGTYQVRRNASESALELVGADGKVAATIPMHGETVGVPRLPASEREDDDRAAFPIPEPLTKTAANRSTTVSAAMPASDWPDTFMTILHWLDPRFRS